MKFSQCPSSCPNFLRAACFFGHINYRFFYNIHQVVQIFHAYAQGRHYDNDIAERTCQYAFFPCTVRDFPSHLFFPRIRFFRCPVFYKLDTGNQAFISDIADTMQNFNLFKSVFKESDFRLNISDCFLFSRKF